MPPGRNVIERTWENDWTMSGADPGNSLSVINSRQRRQFLLKK